jgi:hypothetical protein
VAQRLPHKNGIGRGPRSDPSDHHKSRFAQRAIGGFEIELNEAFDIPTLTLTLTLTLTRMCTVTCPVPRRSPTNRQVTNRRLNRIKPEPQSG